MSSKFKFLDESILLRASRFTPWVPSLWQWVSETDRSFDIVAAMTIGFESISDAGRAIAARQEVPFVTYPLVHLGAGEKPGEDTVGQFYTMRHQNAVVRSSDRVIAQTRSEEAYYIDHGVRQENITVVGPGVTPSEVLGGDGSRFRQDFGIDSPLILFVGYLSQDKGAFDTVEAVRRMLADGMQVELALIGAVPTSFQAYFEQIPPSEKEHFHLLGAVDDSVKQDALAAADIFAMPSRTDSFGITYLEAWLYGLPVVAARTWGVTDVVYDGEDGIVIPFGDADALASAFETLLEDQSLASEMGSRGRGKVYAKHLWERKVKAIESIYIGLTP